MFVDDHDDLVLVVQIVQIVVVVMWLLLFFDLFNFFQTEVEDDEEWSVQCNEGGKSSLPVAGIVVDDDGGSPSSLSPSSIASSSSTPSCSATSAFSSTAK